MYEVRYDDLKQGPTTITSHETYDLAYEYAQQTSEENEGCIWVELNGNYLIGFYDGQPDVDE